ncbi:helix-turn-helix and ligand-binding sensor domain-containing protein [Flavobacterium cellulosilyticum]|uniref:Regulator n=1 Tax=Flavobacterium cellulosilyticum TaxID=2541731 RepID=A0A4R5CEE4_9FLAO|nr:triple tyrosine motif-containing protein [Flavobacterium cellulosilyticum]TDD96633.1 regulator [Flavobacterium cellulosilyticum]
MNLIRTIIILYLVLFSNILLGQEKVIGLPEIRNYKKADYNGDPQNWEIDQDKNGNLYFANNKGLYQFDGFSWHKYSLPNSGLIRSFKIDKSGKIFVGGENEFGYFKPNLKGKMEYFSLSNSINKVNLKLMDIVWKIHLYNDEVIFQTFVKAYILKGNNLTLLAPPSRFQFSFQVNNRLYFQDHSLGILEYKNGKLYPMQGTTSLNGDEIWGIFPMPENKLLIATLNNGLYLYDYKKIIPWNTQANTFIQKYDCLGGTTLNNKFIILNSSTNGIIIFDTSGKIIQHINHEKGLHNNTVLASYVDDKNNLWLGLNNGIAYINENSPNTHMGYSYGLSTVYASAIYKENIYVATDQGLYYHSLIDNHKEEAFKFVEGTSGQTWNIQVIDNQLICGSNKGALIIDNGKIINKINSLGHLYFKKIPNKPDFMIGTNYNGFGLYKKVSNNWQFIDQIDGINSYPYSFAIDNKYIWYKKDDLIYRLTISEDMKKFENIKTYKNISIIDKVIGSIQNINNVIYFQTNNHFYTYSASKESFVKDEKLSAIFKNIPKIKSLNEDADGNLWYVFNESLGVLMKDQNDKFKNVVAPLSNFTGNLVTNFFSVSTINSENIFIGLTDGLAHYNSKQKNNYSNKPKAIIRSFIHSGDTLILNNGQKKIDKHKLPYKFNNVKFTFSSPTYENLNNVEFSFLLEGFDSNWSNWSNTAAKEYTNLREGNYVMKLKVRNSYGVQSDETSLLFSISPPWYRHSLAYFIYIAFIFLSIYFIRERMKIKIRRNKYYQTVEQRKLYLEKEAKIRLEQYELEREIEKLKNEKLKEKILVKDKDLVSNSLQIIKKNKVLNGIMSKLKNINEEPFEASTKSQFTKLKKSIAQEVSSENNWGNLEKHIKNVHYDFLKRLKEKHPKISSRELDLSTYLLINMSTKELAEVMNISTGGVEVARYRLRKKLGLNNKENLHSYLMNI